MGKALFIRPGTREIAYLWYCLAFSGSAIPYAYVYCMQERSLNGDDQYA
jgi:hypothetical protein